MDDQAAIDTPTTGSPRRKRPPLDLDTALYLQSQAARVQEPNVAPKRADSSVALSGGIREGVQQGANQQQQPLGARQFASSATNLNLNHSQLASLPETPVKSTIISPTGSQPPQSSQAQLQLQAQDQAQAQAQSFDQAPNQSSQGIQANLSKPDTVSSSTSVSSVASASLAIHQAVPVLRKHTLPANLSVDYIDCLSNEDISHQQQHQATFGGSRMGLCRKHLHRFHQRSNRVEPANLASLSDHTLDRIPSMESFGGPEAEAEISTPGVGLYPIAASEARQRAFFQVGCESPLLGHDELHRYFPEGRVSVYVCTWNQNRKRSSPMSCEHLLLPEKLLRVPDIYAVGVQEAFSSQSEHLRDWEVQLQSALGPTHVLLHSCSLGVLHLGLFVRRDLVWFCSRPEESAFNSRTMPTNMINTKGAVSIAFSFFGTSFMFINCHFPAHEHRLRDRVEEYQRIINSIDLPKNLKLLKPRYLSNDSTARFDCVFFMGDLNFRLEQRSFDETINLLDDIMQSKEPSFEPLTQHDELLKVMDANQAFRGFDEAPIKFPPTYKFLAKTNKYDRATQRVPSYTDRILFRSKRQRHIRCLGYDWLPQLLSSDHKPVYCLFSVLIRPGREQRLIGSLNAGLFQRQVYLEALKRRAQNPDNIRDVTETGGSLMCSIS